MLFTVVVAAYDSIYWLKGGVEVNRFETMQYMDTTPAIVDGETVVISAGKKVHWLQDGRELDVFTMEGVGRFGKPAVLTDGTIVIKGGDNVYWLKNGDLLHKYYSGSINPSAPSVLSDNTVVVSGKGVLWLNSGELVASYDVGSCSSNTMHPFPVLDDDTVVVGCPNGAVLWLNSGSKTASYQIHVFSAADLRNYRISNPARLSDGTVVVSTARGGLYWLKDGNMISGVSVAGSDVLTAPSVLNNDIVMVSAMNRIHYLRKNVWFGEIRIERLRTDIVGEPNVWHSKSTMLPDGSAVIGSTDGRVTWLKGW